MLVPHSRRTMALSSATLISGFARSARAALSLHNLLRAQPAIAASLMLAAGVPVKVVSEMLGHSSPTITLAIYAHVMPGMAKKAGERRSAALGL